MEPADQLPDPPEAWRILCQTISEACTHYHSTSGDPEALERMVGLLIDMAARALVCRGCEKAFAKKHVAAIFDVCWQEHAYRKKNN